MKLVRCDHHHNRDAVATFGIQTLAPGARPIGAGVARVYVDLCSECADELSTFLPVGPLPVDSDEH